MISEIADRNQCKNTKTKSSALFFSGIKSEQRKRLNDSELCSSSGVAGAQTSDGTDRASWGGLHFCSCRANRPPQVDFADRATSLIAP